MLVAVDDQGLGIGHSLDREPVELACVSGLAASFAEIRVVHVRCDDDLGQAEPVPDQLLGLAGIVELVKMSKRRPGDDGRRARLRRRPLPPEPRRSGPGLRP